MMNNIDYNVKYVINDNNELASLKEWDMLLNWHKPYKSGEIVRFCEGFFQLNNDLNPCLIAKIIVITCLLDKPTDYLYGYTFAVDFEAMAGNFLGNLTLNPEQYAEQNPHDFLLRKDDPFWDSVVLDFYF